MRYRRTYHFVDTEKEAKEFCQFIDNSHTSYARQHYPSTYTPWSSSDNTEHAYVCWYYEKM